MYLILAHLFIKVSRPGDSEVTFLVFEPNCHLLLHSNHSKVEAIPLSALPKDTTSELAGLFSTLTLLIRDVEAAAFTNASVSDHCTSASVIIKVKPLSRRFYH